ncbi:hypothetical protein K438DRAFT_999975 [Mycena galopus ATCC 62051]|nr:hypothetical protein K438DRAFT_999975 [Mycena galopus ATCC 62051]
MSTSNASEASQNSLIRDILRSHHQLPPAQLASILDSLSDQLSRCDEEVAQLHVRMNELAVHRVALQDQYDRCKTFLAPIRRLPSEILADIFALSGNAGAEPFAGQDFETFLRLYRLAQHHLLAASQVCIRWHNIALSTPSLWTNIRLHSGVWSSPVMTEKAMGLLRSALARSGHGPLTILVDNLTSSTHGPALQLLAQHSARWQQAVFRCPASDFEHLSRAKGNLPTLETLEISTEEPTEVSQPVTVFEMAPRLRDFVMSGTLGTRILTPPLDCLSNVRCLNLASTDIATAVSAMAHLSVANSFTLQFYLDDWTSSRSHAIDLDITHTSSDVANLAIGLLGDFFKHHCLHALGDIFAGLTLTRLEGLTFDSQGYPRFPLVWPQTHFLALCQRSSFHAHLNSLCLYHVHITEAQLLQCLAVLPGLTTLAIADHERVGGRGVNLELISNTLLLALTRTPDGSCLIPRLEALRLRSRLQFNDNVFLALVLSRLEPGRRFESVLRILPHWTQGRRIDDAVVAQLRARVAEGELTIYLPGSQ